MCRYATRLQGLLIVRPSRVVKAVVDVAAVLQSVQGRCEKATALTRGATNATAQAGGDGKQRPQNNVLATRGGSNGVSMKRLVVIVGIGRFNRRNERAKRIFCRRSGPWRHLQLVRLLRFHYATW
jgi:hypothetical protein